jgi:hypothetical protein
MASSERFLPWWDREIDEDSRRPFRADVREAAHRVWKLVSSKTQEILGDPGDAQRGSCIRINEQAVREAALCHVDAHRFPPSALYSFMTSKFL